MTISIPLLTAERATEIAARVAGCLKAGDCLLLSGPVGAGKTHFARSIIQTMLGRAEDVPSPTFTLVQTYETSSGEVWHADLYRLSHIDELAELGLEDAFDTAITLIEWPDRLGSARPARCLELDFSIPDLETDLRILNISVNGNWDWIEAFTNV